MATVAAVMAEAEAPAKRKPPAYGEAARDAVKSIIDGLVTEMSSRIGEVRKRADELEQRMLESTADAKGTLDDTIAILQAVGDEASRLGATLDAMNLQLSGVKRLNGSRG